MAATETHIVEVEKAWATFLTDAEDGQDCFITDPGHYGMMAYRNGTDYYEYPATRYWDGAAWNYLPIVADDIYAFGDVNVTDYINKYGDTTTGLDFTTAGAIAMQANGLAFITADGNANSLTIGMPVALGGNQISYDGTETGINMNASSMVGIGAPDSITSWLSLYQTANPAEHYVDFRHSNYSQAVDVNMVETAFAQIDIADPSSGGAVMRFVDSHLTDSTALKMYASCAGIDPEDGDATPFKFIASGATQYAARFFENTDNLLDIYADGRMRVYSNFIMPSDGGVYKWITTDSNDDADTGIQVGADDVVVMNNVASCDNMALDIQSSGYSKYRFYNNSEDGFQMFYDGLGAYGWKICTPNGASPEKLALQYYNGSSWATVTEWEYVA